MSPYMQTFWTAIFHCTVHEILFFTMFVWWVIFFLELPWLKGLSFERTSCPTNLSSPYKCQVAFAICMKKSPCAGCSLRESRAEHYLLFIKHACRHCLKSCTATIELGKNFYKYDHSFRVPTISLTRTRLTEAALSDTAESTAEFGHILYTHTTIHTYEFFLMYS